MSLYFSHFLLIHVYTYIEINNLLITTKEVFRMQRIIKFRAWHKNMKSMCQDITTDLLNREYLIFMQFIGLTDLNGTDIYEHDIVCQTSLTDENIFIGEIEFLEGSWWIDNGTEKRLVYNDNCRNEIISNRYE